MLMLLSCLPCTLVILQKNIVCLLDNAIFVKKFFYSDVIRLMKDTEEISTLLNAVRRINVTVLLKNGETT